MKIIEPVKKVLISGIICGALLLILSFAVLYLTINLFPALAEEYYNPVFWPGNDRALLYFLHPFVLSIALAWVWHRFKSILTGNWLMRGLEFGLIYLLIGTIPSMWLTFSAINVSFSMVFSWVLYGLLQAIICGLIFSKLNP